MLMPSAWLSPESGPWTPISIVGLLPPPELELLPVEELPPLEAAGFDELPAHAESASTPATTNAPARARLIVRTASPP
jgi:hypothetical protein